MSPNETKTVTQFPWMPESTISGNLAIFNLRENLLLRLKNDKGVHVETLFAAIGAIMGFAALNAALNQAAKTIERGEELPLNGLLLLDTKTGQRFLLGEMINGVLYTDQLSLRNLMLGALSGVGDLKLESLPDLGKIAGHVTSTLGTADFGKLSFTPTNHQPHAGPVPLVKALWPFICGLFRMPLDKQIKSPTPPNEPPLKEMHWPVVASCVAAQYVNKTKGILSPAVAYSIVMESAIIASKVDPEVIEPGKWNVSASGGKIFVSRRKV